MILNFWVEDLLKEYQRLKELNIGVLSEIMYVNISSPYHFFVINDPDNNEIEITGGIK
jgi:lactoylglutathione lyase